LNSGQIRRSTPDDAQELDELTRRSILHWGYDADILEWGGDDIRVTEEWVTQSMVYVLENGDRIVGYYGFKDMSSNPVLDKMFLDTDQIGKGFGEQLWRHAVAVARDLGVETFAIYADSNAAGFYEAMGAVAEQRIETGRSDFGLTLLRYHVGDDN
jgi:GNAT superfamily N-acetyltransferase